MRRIIGLLFLFGGLQAQQPWTLSDCINYARNHNISLKQTAITNEINKNNLDQAKAQTLPTFNLGAAHTYNFGKTIDRFTNTFANTQVLSQNFFVSSNLVLWSGLSQYNTIKANEYNYMSGNEQLKQMENDISLNVASAYVSVIFTEELLLISEKQMAITKEQLERTLRLVEAGSVAKSVEFDIRAQLANELLNVTTAENNYAIAMLNLRQLMNFDSIANFNIEKPQIESMIAAFGNLNVNAVYDKALQNQPAIRGSEFAILSAERMLAAARGRRSPTLSFNASMGTGTSGLAKDILGYSVTGYQPSGFTGRGDTVYTPVTQIQTRQTPFAEQFKSNVNKSLGLTLTIPLFNGLQTHTSVKNAQLNAYSAHLNMDLARQNLYKNIAQAFANAKAAFNKYEASKLSVDAAAESFRYAQQKFDAGAISSFDYSSSKNRLFAAESNLLQAKYDYLFKLKVLDYYQGIPLSF